MPRPRLQEASSHRNVRWPVPLARFRRFLSLHSPARRNGTFLLARQSFSYGDYQHAQLEAESETEPPARRRSVCLKPLPLLAVDAHALVPLERGSVKFRWRDGKERGNGSAANSVAARKAGGGSAAERKFFGRLVARLLQTCAPRRQQPPAPPRRTSGSLVITRERKVDAFAAEVKHRSGVSGRLRLRGGGEFFSATAFPRLGSVEVDCKRGGARLLTLSGSAGTLRLRAAPASAASKQGKSEDDDGDEEAAAEGLVPLLHWRLVGADRVHRSTVTLSPTLRAPLVLGGSCEVALAPTGRHSVHITPPGGDAQFSMTSAPTTPAVGGQHPSVRLRVGPQDGAHSIVNYEGGLRCGIEHSAVSSSKRSTVTARAHLSGSLPPTVSVACTTRGGWGTGSANVTTAGDAAVAIEAGSPSGSLSIACSVSHAQRCPAMSARWAWHFL
jgi:hypothetical protein